MSKSLDDLAKLADSILIGNMTPSMNAAIDDLLASGHTPRQILARVRQQTKGLTLKQVEAYLESKQPSA